MSKMNGRTKATPITMRDVAHLAGVSQSTVSRVLSKSLSSVPISKDTADKVLSAVEQLGYYPNLTASSLRKQRTFMVAVLIADISNSFYHSITRGIQDVADQYGYDVLIANSDHLYENEKHFCRAMMRRPVDGIILVPYHLTVEEIDEVIQRTGATVTMLGSHINHPLIDTLAGDDDQATYDAVRWLIENKQHTDIAYIRVPLSYPPGLRRFNAYLAAMRDCGLTIRDEWIQEGDFSIEGGQRTMRALLSSPHPPQAVVACNDLMALGALNVALDMKWRVPEDVAIVGFDDIPLASLVRPSLTTITQLSTDIGTQLAEMLFERINGVVSGPSRHWTIPLHLIERQST
ncbi:MAG: LacI family DNA-binding transcriptional regulator [Anaerolineae bacterium]